MSVPRNRHFRLRQVLCSRKLLRHLNFSTQKTMRLAQQLYEGVDIKGSGTVGLITYLRTDSTRVSEEAEAAAAEYIGTNYGADYVGGSADVKKNTAKIQDAHEAIRPTDLNRVSGYGKRILKP